MSATKEIPDLQRVFDPALYASGDPNQYGLPLDLYDRMREDHPCYKVYLDHPLLIDEVWVVSRYADIEKVDRTPETFAADIKHPLLWQYAPLDPEFKPGLLCQDGELHRSRRAQMNKAFRPTAMHRLEEKFRGYAREVVDAALAKGSINFVTDLAHALPVQALGDVLGVAKEDRAKFFGWVDTFASPFDERVAPDMETVGKALMDLWQYGSDTVARKRECPSDDVLSKLAEIGISDDEVQGNIGLFASGAAETTRANLCHGMRELLHNPEQMAWLRERADDIPATVAQEIVRVGNAAINLCRTARHDTELHGQQIKEGDKVAMLFPSGNFDPTVFEDARTMDLARSPNPHLSFGRGPHSCLGKHVAALEIKILLEELLQRTKEIRPAGEIDYIGDCFTRGVYSLPVTLIPA